MFTMVHKWPLKLRVFSVCHSPYTYTRLTEIPINEYWMNPKDLKKGLCTGVKQDLYFPGFPTLKHIEHTVSVFSIHCIKSAPLT